MDNSENNLVKVSRKFKAPLEALWKAWTEPERFKQWYGPKGFTVPTCKIDLQIGGQHLWSMQSPDGNQMFFTGEFKEIVPMERLVFTDSMSDAEGKVMSMEGMHTTMEVTVTFKFADGITTVTVSHVGNEQAGLGWEQAFDKLETLL